MYNDISNEYVYTHTHTHTHIYTYTYAYITQEMNACASQATPRSTLAIIFNDYG